MKAVWMERFGDPAEVLTCPELPDPDTAGRGEVLLDLVASPVNPADLFLIQGIYAILPDLPYAAGMEGVARVTRCGDGVEHLTVGDLVLIGAGALRADVEATYPLTEVQAALEHSTRPARWTISTCAA